MKGFNNVGQRCLGVLVLVAMASCSDSEVRDGVAGGKADVPSGSDSVSGDTTVTEVPCRADAECATLQDGYPCVAWRCNTDAGRCEATNQPDGGPCSDGCTTNGTCQDGACGNGSPVLCDDGDSCTTDSCRPDVGCTAVKLDGCCIGSCEGRVCGDDGCGESCGACVAGSTCDETSGQCVTCTKQCSGKTCGSDGCGGTCGTCLANEECTPGGQCKAEACVPKCSDKECGPNGCGGSCGNCAQDEQCSTQGQCEPECQPACVGKDCGPDGCSGTCGSCDADEQCNSGVCEKTCVPQCSGKACGDDGCGDVCGSCLGGKVCNKVGQCEAPQCVPACDGKKCGPDGCNGVCGTCAVGLDCSPTGTCGPPSCGDTVCGVTENCTNCIDDCGCDDGEICSLAGVCEVPTACAGITYDGCCAGQTLKYCDGTGIVVAACTESCGWSTTGSYYDCDQIGEDPSGESPIECPDCTPACTGKACGPDGCGGSCGDCADGERCDDDGLCVEDGCGDVTYEGCCDGVELRYCDGTGLITQTCADTCGWSTAGSYYNCGEVGADPSGANPIACGACVADCTGKACGDDGCGGSCGVCGEDQRCTTEGICEDEPPCGGVTYEGCCDGLQLKYCDGSGLVDQTCADSCGWSTAGSYYNCGEVGPDPSGANPIACAACVPQCTGKACGDDGCGGSCGLCPEGERCTTDGLCEAEDPCDGVTYEGCCDGVQLKYCDGAGVVDVDCGDSCGWSTSGSYYNCGEIGEDPTGENLIACGECVPNCLGKACGDDGCGGTCGSCAEGDRCTTEGLCEPESPCGDVTFEGCCDGLVLKYCDGAAVITSECGDTCGWSTSASYYNCGEVGEDPSGSNPIACTACVSDCTGKACGDDGCGGSCGTCAEGDRCTLEDLCEPEDPCGDVTYEGCCDGALLKYCDGGGIVESECGDSCGWSTTGSYYNCGEIGEDPSGSNPIACGECVADCTGKACGDDGCGGSCGECVVGDRCTDAGLCEPEDPCGGVTYEGCCNGLELQYCDGTGVVTFACPDSCGWSAEGSYYNCGENGADPSGTNPLACGACVPDCGTRVCGDNGCGGSCGDCAADERCTTDGLCEVEDPCGGVTYEGCCDGLTLRYCNGSAVLNFECGDTCGWSTSAAFYNCGEVGEDPSGSNPIQCGACVVDCDGKQCGDDGCGGTCGTCTGGALCSSDGQCGACVADCTGKACGDDGCGGTCGACADGERCTDAGLCEVENPCGGVTYEGCCDGQTLTYCDGAGVVTFECDDTCGWSTSGAYYNCGEVGEDPSGTNPILCGACEADCTGKACGDDGCGGTCGACAEGERCNTSGVCELEDPCGGVTFAGCCEGAELRYCSGSGVITQTCATTCGWSAAGSYYDCGEVGADPSLVNPIACTPCVPECTGKACGDDGCGGSCGDCADGQRCTVEGLCEVEDPCGGLSYEGCCEGNELRYCDGLGVIEQTCADTCGWSTAGAYYNCGETGADPTGANPIACGACVADCTGKACGDDGCGGTCGDCAEGERCTVEGLCEAEDPCEGVTYEGCCNGNELRYCDGTGIVTLTCADTCGWSTDGGYYNCGEQGQDPSGTHPLSCGTCQPDCTGKACGDDGCGGTCGACGAGDRCNAEGLCEPEDPCQGITFEGCCNGLELRYCDATGVVTLACPDSCGWSAEGSFYNCGEVGEDPSGTNPLSCGVCEPVCTGKACGDDGCGGTCGECGDGERCTAEGICEVEDPCGGVTFEGCCSGLELRYCDGTGVVTSACVDSCGWATSGSYYNCGETGADPSGTHPRPCEACVPDCANKVCGDDGCGGSCGECAGGERCTTDGICELEDPCGGVTDEGCCDGLTLSYCGGSALVSQTCADGCGWSATSGYYDCGGQGADPSGVNPIGCPGACVPTCGTKACGDDGCGGVCGTCLDGSTCNAEGLCEPADPCLGVTEIGCCDGLELNYCGFSGLVSQTCVDSCGWSTSSGYYDCGEVGEDPSGANPIACAGSCVPTCGTKNCGDDGCGGSCGVCDAGDICNTTGQCEVEDPCLGVTEEGCCDGLELNYCGFSGLVSQTCVDSCGWSTSSGYYDCGEVGEDPSGANPIACPGSCVPACGTKTCGDDGCGGSCGVCDAGDICNPAGECEADTACGEINGTGCCNALELKYCSLGALVTQTCADSCGWSASLSYYDCGEVGPDPSGEFPLACPGSCVPACGTKTCGDDGCGGTCGTCGSGQECGDAGSCEAIPVDLSGYKLVQTSASKTYVFPNGTVVPTGGVLLVVRNASQPAFEDFYDVQLGAGVVFINTGDSFPSINGDETFSLVAPAGAAIDGPTVAHSVTTKNYTRVLPLASASVAASWSNPAPSPGSVSASFDGPIAYISEWADPTGTGQFVYEFLELHVLGE